MTSYDDVQTMAPAASTAVERSAPRPRRRLTARLEPFDSYWQAPADVDKGYAKFAAYYRTNYLPHIPTDHGCRILVLSCGPGYLVALLQQAGYTNVVGIDSDPEKIALAVALMWRSVPHLVGIFGAVRDSARARGLNGLSPRYLIPGIIQAVGFGLATSDALRARGLD